jgi:hypothetical protein
LLNIVLTFMWGSISMYKTGIKQKGITGKVLILIGIYLIQLFCYQALIVATSDGNNSVIRKCFSPSQQDSNSAISVFRTLEKHCEYGKETPVKKGINESAFIGTILTPQLTPKLEIANHTSPLLLSDISYKRYLKVNVFRI